MEHDTNRDQLTGLLTMSSFADYAHDILDQCEADGTQPHFVYFNVSNLKVYNNRFGFEGGDELLKFAAHTIKESFDHALASRFGDDRFVLLTYGDDLYEGIERVHEAVRTFNPESVTEISAGVYDYEPGVEVSAACDRAKLACDYLNGRYDRYYHVYDDSLLADRNRRQAVLDRFYSAIEEGHIQAYYQPIVRSIGNGVCGCEALARWIDPALGMISPAEFIPVLEESRLIHHLDLCIVDRVCHDYLALAEAGLSPIPTNVNLSRYDMELCDIVAEVQKRLDKHGVPHDMVNIEVTESAFAHNQQLLHETIDRFHAIGMQVWIDDFGAGYSSLNVIREFDFDVVKIDLGFMRHSNEQSLERSRIMLPHLVNMSKELGMQTLAEGVETMDQFEFLKSVGCEKVQGYAFAKPMSFEDAREKLAASENVEDSRSRVYYDNIGAVNLMRPHTIDTNMSREMGIASGLPAAIVEFYDGKIRYLLWNDSYVDYLVDIGMNSIENSEKQMNDLTRPQSQGFFAASEKGKETGDWLHLMFYEGEDLCTGMARLIDIDEATGAFSYVYIAFNVGRYLKRAGYEPPKQA
ncbi:MAG: bifunctional diguanylate cyclase/phosphodiesterase [Eggerthellaceae bacterium]|nr:bifunctional diguanylate cyclase/phosphodiesterase [Eggerthellaceae bacterium]